MTSLEIHYRAGGKMGLGTKVPEWAAVGAERRWESVAKPQQQKTGMLKEC